MGAGLIAYAKLNIEAYPNPAPVILEITAQAAGLSAEEMEKYYTTPMEIGLYSTPGIDNIRSTSFYGLSFVRVTFKYGVDYYFAYTQAALSLQQNVQLPGNQVATDPAVESGRRSLSLPGGRPAAFRSDRICARCRTGSRCGDCRLFPASWPINSWGGTTKEFEVEADLDKLQAYSITFRSCSTALSNSNINVGGREITVGQQSVNIRGVGLIDDGGNDDLTQGYHVDDIQNVVLGQFNGLPVLVKDVARVYVGYVPRLGIAGRDHEDDVAASIVVMGRTQHTNDIVPAHQSHSRRRSTVTAPCRPGVKLVPYYDRTTLVNVTTHTVLHNLIFGCLLVFLIQWIFLGNLRSAIIVGINIPFALVLLDHHPGAAGPGCEPAVDRCGRFRHHHRFGSHSGREHLSQSASMPRPASARWSRICTREPMGPIPRASGAALDQSAAHDLRLGAAGRPGHFVFHRHHHRGVRSAVHDAGRRGTDFRTDGADLRLRPGRRADRDFHGDAGVVVAPAARASARKPRPSWFAACTGFTGPCSSLRSAGGRSWSAIGVGFLVLVGLLIPFLGSEFLPALEEGNYWIRASMPQTMSLDAGTEATRKMREILLRHPEIITVVSQHGRPDNGSDASPFSNVELFAPLRPYRSSGPPE